VLVETKWDTETQFWGTTPIECNVAPYTKRHPSPNFTKIHPRLSEDSCRQIKQIKEHESNQSDSPYLVDNNTLYNINYYQLRRAIKWLLLPSMGSNDSHQLILLQQDICITEHSVRTRWGLNTSTADQGPQSQLLPEPDARYLADTISLEFPF